MQTPGVNAEKGAAIIEIRETMTRRELLKAAIDRGPLRLRLETLNPVPK